ncbi:histone acetyltransferase HAC1-like isoform X1 [Camellia sinensis]|uniref:histone acetyltransferase HAC1-like isoform X1 n=1 Tax=Camellia sinensis TaxID=4442 RepID=UPI0010365C6D|nr:histone acetyltransferase HAC1-like isoform X1 [Camellia sinensis]
MMDVKAYTLGQVCNQVASQFVSNDSHLPQLREIDFHQHSIHGDSLADWYKDPRMSHVNEFFKNKTTKHSMQKTNREWGQWTSGHVRVSQSQLSVDGASKECMNQKIPPRRLQLQNMIQHEISGASFSSQVAHCLTSPFVNSNSPYPVVDYSMVVWNNSNTLQTNNVNDSSFFEGRSFGSSKGSPCDGYNRGVATTFMGTRHVASGMVPSPEKISSITACSDADMHSDTGPFDGAPTFPSSSLLSESSSENYVQQKHLNEGELNLIKHEGFMENNQNVYSERVPLFFRENLELPFPDLQNLQKDAQRIPEASDIFPRANLDISKPTCEDLLEPKLQMPGSHQFHQQHQDERLNEIAPRKTSKQLYLCSEQSHGVKHVSSESYAILFGPTGAAKVVHSSDLTFKTILVSYMNYKRMNVDGNQVSFMKHMHATLCNESTCYCDQYSELVSHFDNCHCWECNICKPVRRFCVTGKPLGGSRKQGKVHFEGSCDTDFSCTPVPTEDNLPPPKRLKIGNPGSLETGVSYVVASSKNQPCEPEKLSHLQQLPDAPVSNNLDEMEIKMGVSTPLQDSISTASSSRNNVTETAQRSDLKGTPIHPEEFIGCSKEGETAHECISEVRNNVMDNFKKSEELIVDHKVEEREVRTKSDQANLETKSNLIAPAANSETKMEEPKIMGVSLIEFFTVEEMKEHLLSLRQWVGQEVKGSPMAYSVGENSCQLCAMDKLVLAPAPIYCSACGARMKFGMVYYCGLDEMGTQHCFCTSCFKKSRGGDISFHGISVSKEKLHKEKNDHEDEESWVQCDKCKGWQHQICGLYNDKRDLGGKAEYICPKCYLEGIEVGERVPLPKTAAFGAKDLPTTMLSDYIEQRLFRRLNQEREERANSLQKNLDEVPGATDLVVRVVLSVSKLLKVKQQFLDIFHDENYPTEFPYRSKVILLFQKIEGVDVCLFGMYIQEFGSECGQPNQRCVYISYLDSVKYFRPEIRTVSGEALRTFVYHEILIGYLDFCKKRGFATCYIWACPPLKGEDYILYCHPESQRTPKADKLRQWYKSMLRKAAKENIVVHCTNLYDHFFVPTGECNIKITAARLPYFDGDYCSGAAVDMIKNIEQGSQVGSQSKGKNVLTKRTLKAMGHTNLSDNATKDILLMQKLGQTIFPVKEDFIMAHLQFTCMCCREMIRSGSRWYCNECKNFQLCERCHDVEQNLNEWNTHTSNTGEKHFISQVAVNDVPIDTVDTDVILDNGYFENRHSFLSFCQGSHYQFDTLRRAKHSSMMILFHLHNSTEPGVGATCYICHQDIMVNQGWHCEICPGFAACDGCYQIKGGDFHIHKLSQRSSIINCGAKNRQAQLHKHMPMREALDVLLMHASQCNATKIKPCSYPNCLQVRKLFHHTQQCNLRLAGGCQVCQKIWKLLKEHSKNCRDSGCGVPRCMDLKKRAELLASQSETRRRAAVVGSLRDS